MYGGQLHALGNVHCQLHLIRGGHIAAKIDCHVHLAVPWYSSTEIGLIGILSVRAIDHMHCDRLTKLWSTLSTNL